jgi:multidrug transporter EmrE-like cation transporter
MTLTGWLWVIICSLSAASSSFLLRRSIDNIGKFEFELRSFFNLATQPLFFIGIILYGLTGIIWLRVLATEQLNIAYPVLISITFILVAFGSMVFFKEPMSAVKLVGLVLIVFGISFVARG